jgi:hypothetical protein
VIIGRQGRSHRSRPARGGSDRQATVPVLLVGVIGVLGVIVGHWGFTTPAASASAPGTVMVRTTCQTPTRLVVFDRGHAVDQIEAREPGLYLLRLSHPSSTNAEVGVSFEQRRAVRELPQSDDGALMVPASWCASSAQGHGLLPLLGH